jgi:hypothetical protein
MPVYAYGAPGPALMDSAGGMASLWHPLAVEPGIVWLCGIGHCIVNKQS